MSLFNISSIWRRRDDTYFLKFAFGVDETLGGKTRFLKKCVLLRQDAILQSTSLVMSPEIRIFVCARWRLPLLGVDEALGGQCRLLKMRVLR